jgi:predicted DNA-binding helix-hairpin-helix protein
MRGLARRYWTFASREHISNAWPGSTLAKSSQSLPTRRNTMPPAPSSGTAKRDSKDGKGSAPPRAWASATPYAPDGRCISLLKILLTNSCIFDCHYCINRKSSNVRRARFTPEEVVELTLSFYRRNYIEGLFLSSGIIARPQLHDGADVEVRRSLREDHEFRGYIHLKTIPTPIPSWYARQASCGPHLDQRRASTAGG